MSFTFTGPSIAGVPLSAWAIFLAVILGLLALDLGVFHRKAHEVKMKEALVWSGVWIGVALLFNLFLFFNWKVMFPASEYSSADAGKAFLTGYLVEKALSVDNIFVILTIFTFFAIPNMYQHRVLFWGIVGALVFRLAFILIGAELLDRFDWLVLIFGLLLIFTAWKMIKAHGQEIDLKNHKLIKWANRVIPLTPNLDGQRFWTVENGRRVATPLFLALLLVEFSDIVFAVDSIPAIFAITRDPFIVFTSNVFAILGLRSLFFALKGLLGLFHYLSYGLAAILAFVGGKMLYTFYVHQVVGDRTYKFPVAWSLGIIATLLTVTIAASLLRRPKEQAALPGV